MQEMSKAQVTGRRARAILGWQLAGSGPGRKMSASLRTREGREE